MTRRLVGLGLLLCAAAPATAQSTSAQDEAIIRAEVAKRLERIQAERAAAEKAARAIRNCDSYKYSPHHMDAETAAICYRVWADKANRTLGR